MTFNPALAQIHDRLRSDLPYFAKSVLKIKTKDGRISPFTLNKAQLYLHYRLEDQLKRTGMVRAIILKGRQQGCSTYVSARYYWKTVWNDAKSVFILSHISQTTKALFKMAERYHTLSHPQVRPKIKINNQKELVFENMSQYSVGTAGSGSVGRGETVQFFHGSEVAFYENTDDIDTGVLQTVADVPGTEIILESTANGKGNYFHNKCQTAISDPDTSYELIFIPWYWQDEYRAMPPKDFVPTEEEQRLIELYKLDYRQLYWRRKKIAEFKSSGANGTWKFKQEYPCNIEEAFQTTGESLVDSLAVEEARVNQRIDERSPVVIGVDPARSGDRTAIVIRQGRQVKERIVYSKMDEMTLAGIVANLIKEWGAVKVFIDRACGAGTVDRLHELGYRREVTSVHFGERAMDDDRFLNKRAEMAYAVKEWFEGGDVSIPNYDDLITDIMAIPSMVQTSSSKWKLESKDNIKKMFGQSPDLFDALMLTFAYPINQGIMEANRIKKAEGVTKRFSPSKTQRSRHKYAQKKVLPRFKTWD